MRTFFLVLIASALTLTVQAQDADKDMKKASRLVSSYRVDPANNADKLDEALTLINNAVKDGEVAKQSKTWQTYGEVYNEVLTSEVQVLALNPEQEIQNPGACVEAVKGYAKAAELAEKKYETKDALKALSGILNNTNYMGSLLLQRGDYASAYAAYDALITGNDLLIAEGEESLFASTSEYQEQIYWGALAAYSGGNLAEAEKLFTRLLDEGYENADVYAAMFDIKNKQGDEAAAQNFLKEGISKFPNDKGLMFAEINYALAQGDLDALVGKLKNAMEAEPENITIPTTLGNVYDQLYQKALEDGDQPKADEYYENAKTYFGKALSMDDTYFDAVYMMGAVEYNRAAEYAEQVNALAEDYSKEGTQKYEAAKTQMFEQFDKALPHFLKAESLNPNDRNTLIALREIYARKDQLDKSNEYKEKLESSN